MEARSGLGAQERAAEVAQYEFSIAQLQWNHISNTSCEMRRSEFQTQEALATLSREVVAQREELLEMQSHLHPHGLASLRAPLAEVLPCLGA